MFTSNLIRRFATSSMRYSMPLRPMTSLFANRMAFSTAAGRDESDDLSQVRRFSLDEFYVSNDTAPLTDEQAKSYMEFGARLAMVTFKDEDEMMSFKSDFSAALGFLDKLDEVDVKGVEPLGNVFEIYGGNEHNLRREEDFERVDDDQTKEVDFKTELNKMNKHMKGHYIVLNKPKVFNPDSE